MGVKNIKHDRESDTLLCLGQNVNDIDESRSVRNEIFPSSS